MSTSNIPDTVSIDNHFVDGPPCLQALAKSGVPDGSRNEALYNFAVFAKKLHPGNDNLDDDARSVFLDEVNGKVLKPPLGHREVAKTLKSVDKKDYGYKCHQQPLSTVCNRAACLKRKFGIGESPYKRKVVIDKIVRVETQPVIWKVTVEGIEIEMGSKTLNDQKLFHVLVIEKALFLPIVEKQEDWAEKVSAKLAVCEVQDAPADASDDGVILHYLEAFCTESVTMEREELLNGVPYHDSDGYTYFNSLDLIEYLKRKRVVNITSAKLWAVLRRLEAKHTVWKVKGKNMRVWGVPTFDGSA